MDMKRMWPVVLLRSSGFFLTHRLAVVSKLFSLTNQLLFGLDVGRKATIAGGRSFPHPYGIVIGERARIAERVVIMQGVTIGYADPDKGQPEIGNDVLIGANAAVLGNVKVGAFSKIGAGAVVVKDVPAYSIVVGNPATVKKLRDKAQIQRDTFAMISTEAANG